MIIEDKEELWKELTKNDAVVLFYHKQYPHMLKKVSTDVLYRDLKRYDFYMVDIKTDKIIKMKETTINNIDQITNLLMSIMDQYEEIDFPYKGPEDQEEKIKVYYNFLIYKGKDVYLCLFGYEKKYKNDQKYVPIMMPFKWGYDNDDPELITLTEYLRRMGNN